ncbi:unnamed protein product [Pleuronectes platessa]|uniref:Uncharacterized protein n=1 Tax=Pleuronectes platessa TaxID=8262 RepID=A0A9N7TP55_PLEPL|nr:unnamed protein product [Pleuronectes platessa]
MVDVGEREEEEEEEEKKSPEGEAAAAAAAAIRCVDVVKWLVRKCETDNDRLCVTPLGAPKSQLRPPSTFSNLHSFATCNWFSLLQFLADQENPSRQGRESYRQEADPCNPLVYYHSSDLPSPDGH